MTLTGYILLWSHLSLRQLFLLLVDCAVLVFSSTFCFLGKRKQTLIKRRSLHLTSTQSFKIRRSQKIHILTAPPVRAPAGRRSRPCSRKRSDMMRSARTITRFAPPRFSNPQQFMGSRSLHNRRLGRETTKKKFNQSHRHPNLAEIAVEPQVAGFTPMVFHPRLKVLHHTKSTWKNVHLFIRHQP